MRRRTASMMLAASCALFGSMQPLRADIGPAAIPGHDDPNPPAIVAPRPASTPNPKAAPIGNPLWAVPLSTLTVTRERPLFSPSRRPPAPVIAAPPAIGPVSPSAPSEPSRPRLTFVGAVSSEFEGFAIFLDAATNNIVRLRTGQDYAGWVLNSVKGREATLKKDGEIATYALPAPNDTPAPSPTIMMPVGATPAPAIPGGPIVVPGPGANFAPYVPRHTPKKGEPDGL